MGMREDGTFIIRRDPSRDSKGNGFRFLLDIWIGNGQTKHISLTKSDVQHIRRTADRALKELDNEQNA